MKYIHGDIVELIKETKVDVVIHGCNCFCNMRAGVALKINNKYPNVLKKDMETKIGDINKLGSYSCAYLSKYNTYIVNGYTQFHWNNGSENELACYHSIQKLFSKIKIKFSGKRIYFPLIGAGLAKGDWGIISKIIDDELIGEEYYCVIKKGRNYKNHDPL